MIRFLPLALVAGFLFSGCATYRAQLDPGGTPGGYRRFFIQRNLNDNHAMDRYIATALEARGLRVDIGPLTMLPPDAEVVVTYQDRWAWDFGDHLVSLRIAMRQVRGGRPLSSAVFTGPATLRKQPADVVARLVDELLEHSLTGSR